MLSESQIESAFAEEGGLFAQAEEDVYTPAVTLWGFLSQALFKAEQRSCLAAVSRIVQLQGGRIEATAMAGGRVELPRLEHHLGAGLLAGELGDFARFGFGERAAYASAWQPAPEWQPVWRTPPMSQPNR